MIMLILYTLFQPTALHISMECILYKRIFFKSLRDLRFHVWQNIVVGQRRKDISKAKMESAGLYVVTMGRRVIITELALLSKQHVRKGVSQQFDGRLRGIRANKIWLGGMRAISPIFYN